jgi:hypothetical protein
LPPVSQSAIFDAPPNASAEAIAPDRASRSSTP